MIHDRMIDDRIIQVRVIPNPIRTFQSAVLIAILAALLFCNACSGAKAPGASPANSTPANSSSNSNSSSLNISTSLPQATVGSSYNSTVKVTGGTAPYTFSIASGQLPSGVLLADNTGTISGAPTAAGNFNFTLGVSDSKGVSNQQPLQIAVANAASNPSPAPTTPSTSSGNSFSNVQHSGGWAQYGQGPPNFVDCSPSPCDGISFSMTQGQGSPSLSGDSTVFWLGGTTPYSDALWNNHLIGTNSSQGVPDSNQTLVPNLHDFTYDVYFYGDNLSLAQALEFDVNQYFGNMGFIFGHECRIAGGNEWDVFDNQAGKWKPTGIPCYPNSNSWNHLTIKVQRTSSNDLLYQSITLNGDTHNLNWTLGHGSSPGWYGVTVNYQMDGDVHQDGYKVYLDNFTFSYQ